MSDDFWLFSHINICSFDCIQISGVLFTCGGFICGVMSVPFDHFKFAHGGLGLLIFLIGILQIVNGLL